MTSCRQTSFLAKLSVGNGRMKPTVFRRTLLILTFLSSVAALLLPVAAFGQNCSLCYTQAAGAGSRFIQALRSGILILVLPPMAICVALFIMAYRKRNTFDE